MIGQPPQKPSLQMRQLGAKMSVDYFELRTSVASVDCLRCDMLAVIFEGVEEDAGNFGR
jgi:hypothetical protein